MIQKGKHPYEKHLSKTFKYTPAIVSINVEMQGVMPNEQMGPIVEATTKIALAHCPCRMESRAPETFADLHQRIRQEKETAEEVHN